MSEPLETPQADPNGHVRMPDWLLERSDLSFGAKCLWALLKRYKGEKALAFARYDKLAEKMGISARQVIRYVDELERAWLLEIILHFPKRNSDGTWDEKTFRSNDFITRDGTSRNFSTRAEQRRDHAAKEAEVKRLKKLSAYG